MPHVSIAPDDRTKLLIKTDYTDRYQIKQLPGARFKNGMWRAPLSWASCVILREIFGYDLEIDEEVYDWARLELKERVTPALYWRDRVDLSEWHVPGPYDDGLRPFQQAGIRFLAAAQSGFLGETMGSGKTVQMIRALMLIEHTSQADVFPALVVCPNSIKLTWKREFARWWSDIDVAVINGTITQRRKILAEDHQVYVINYEGLRSLSRLAGYGAIRLRRCHVCDPLLPEKANPQHRCEWCPKELNLMPFKTLIADEIHRCKDESAKQTRAVWQLGKNTERRFGLSGTAIGDNPSDLWPIMHLIDPNEYPDRGRFIEYFCQAGYNFFGAQEILGLRAEHREAFFKIFDPRFRRLPKDMILPQLPPIIRTQRDVQMGVKQNKAYRAMETHMAALLDGDLLIAPNPLTKLTRLVQFASACGTTHEVEVKVWSERIDPETGESVRFQESVLQQQVELIEPSCKIDAMHDVLEELGDAPLVVASASKRLAVLALTSLERRGISCGIISGDQDIYQRRSAEQDFQAGRIRVLVCVVAAAGEGLTLTRAGHLLWLMRDWSMIKCEQMEQRIHRIGSEVHEVVEIIDLVTINTIESRKLELLAGKKERLEEIVRDRETMAKLLGVAS